MRMHDPTLPISQRERLEERYGRVLRRIVGVHVEWEMGRVKGDEGMARIRDILVQEAGGDA